MTDKVEHFLAHFFSVFMHPLLIPGWTFLVLMSTGNFMSLQIPFPMRWTLTGIIFTTTFFIPALMILLMWRFKMISSLRMPLRSERMAPLVITAVFFYLTYYLLKQINLAPLFYFYMLGATTLAIFGLLITMWWKISLHMIALGGISGAFAALALLSRGEYVSALLILLIISGLTASSRLKLHAHTPGEIYAGYAVGALTMFSLFTLVL